MKGSASAEPRPPRIAVVTAGLMLVEAATLAVASVIHFGVAIPLGVVTVYDPFAGARIPEAILALVMAAGAVGLLARWAGGWWLALAATLLTIVGVFIGVRVVLLGPVARPGDLGYHAGLLIALLATAALLLRLRTRRDRGGQRDRRGAQGEQGNLVGLAASRSSR